MKNIGIYIILLAYCLSLTGCWHTFTNGKVLKRGEVRYGYNISAPGGANINFSEGIGYNSELGFDLSGFRLSYKFQFLPETFLSPAGAVLVKYASAFSTTLGPAYYEPTIIFSKDISDKLTIYGGSNYYNGENDIYDSDTNNSVGNELQRYFLGVQILSKKDDYANNSLMIEANFPAIYYNNNSLFRSNTPSIGIALVRQFK